MRGYAEPVPLGEVVMRPAYKSPANEAWASSTPSGEFKMTVRGEALPFFEDALGRDLHITIDLAPHELGDGCTGEHDPAVNPRCEMAPASS